jgi:hypothetical protein
LGNGRRPDEVVPNADRVGFDDHQARPLELGDRLLGPGLVPGQERIQLRRREGPRRDGQEREQAAGVTSQPALPRQQVVGKIALPAASRQDTQPEG